MFNPVSKLLYLTQDLPDFTHQQQVNMACKAGVRWVQLRVKNMEFEKWKQTAFEVKEITDAFSAMLIINDSVEIAKVVNAHGVHIGQNDLHWQQARSVLGKEKIIGYSTHSIHEVIDASEFDVDYFGLGPFRFTETKEKLTLVLGLNGIGEIISEVRLRGMYKPIIAIGGIGPEDVKAIMDAGASGVAVSSAINKSSDPGNTASMILKSLGNSEATNKIVIA